MWQRFSERARKAIFYAQESAQESGLSIVEPEHILIGALRQGDTNAATMLRSSGHSDSEILSAVKARIVRGKARPARDMTLSPLAKRLIDHAYGEARAANHDYIGTEHLLLGVFRLEKGIAFEVLIEFGVQEMALKKALVELGIYSDLTPPQGRSHPVHRATTQDLVCMLGGAGIYEHLMIALIQPGNLASEATWMQTLDLDAMTQKMVDHIQRKSSLGIGMLPPEDLTSLLTRAHEVAGGEVVTSRHLLTAMLSASDDLAQDAAACGLEIPPQGLEG